MTRRGQFLAKMDRVVPWRELCARIEPVYPKPVNGRPPIGVERMLGTYFLQHWSISGAGNGRVLVMTAHPDDPEFATGGTEVAEPSGENATTTKHGF